MRSHFPNQLRIIIAITLFSLAHVRTSYGFSVDGVDFTDFMFLEVTPNSNLQLSTTGDIYVWTEPAGLFSTSLDFRASGIFLNVPLWASDYIDLNVAPAVTPTVFQDVVLRVSGTVGRLNLGSGGAIV